MVNDAKTIANALSQYAVKIARTNKLAICADEKALDNQSFRNELSYAIASDGGNIVNIHCDLSAPDFNANKIIEDAISSNVDGLVLAPHVDRINKALDLATANRGRLRPLVTS